jgi:hypothetical protein
MPGYGLGYSYLLKRGVQPSVSYGTLTTAWIAATGETDLTILGALNTLETDMATYGLTSKMKALYPFVGGTAAKHKFNFMDARDLDAAFRLTFSGGWTHSSTGALPNGTNGFADTFLNTNTQLNVNSHSFGIYSKTNNTSGTQVYGSFDTSGFKFLQNNLTNANFVSGSLSNVISYTANPSTSLLMLSRTSSTLSKAFRSGVFLDQETFAVSTLPSYNFYLGARNNTGIPDFYSSHELAFAFLGDGLTDTEASNLYTAVQAFQTTLSRQV